MAVGLLRPDEGRSLVFGVDVWAQPLPARRLLGVLPDGLALPERLTDRELLTYLGQLHGLGAATVAARTGELLDVLGLTGDAERTLVVDYSTGMRKKIGGWRSHCCTARGCWCSTSRSKRSTRCPRRRSNGSSTDSWPAAVRCCCPAM